LLTRDVEKNIETVHSGGIHVQVENDQIRAETELDAPEWFA
jgi:hypothetical protein